MAILGVIATFTIPKILVAQQNNTYNAEAKEVISTVAAAYDLYKKNNTPTASTSMSDLMPYINNVSHVTSGLIDQSYSYGTMDCNTDAECYSIHNGGTLATWQGMQFGGTLPSNYMWFFFDPDSTTDETTNGPGKAVAIVLFFNGRISSYTHAFDVPSDPPWFSWN